MANIEDSEEKSASASKIRSDNVYLSAQNFSLVLGGPFYQLLRRARLSDDALMLLRQRIMVITLLAWLPLLLLSAWEGSAWGGKVAIPFLFDVEVHARFLLAMPLLIAAELFVHKRMRLMVDMFLRRNLIPDNAMQTFNAAITSAFRLRNSVLAEALLIAIVYGIGVLVIWRQFFGLDAFTWYATPVEHGSKLSFAGMWYCYVSLPMFQFLLLRWYFRLFIWARFLWQVSRIKLNLIATHPDRMGGLSFITASIYAFTVLAAAHGALVAGQLANRIFYLGASLPQYKAEIAVMVAFLLCVVFVPLLVFSFQLSQLKRDGMREYGTLAQRYVGGFDTKWLRNGAPDDEPFIGSADIQSLADLANSYEVVRTIRIIPVTRDAIIYLSSAVLLPILPLLLTMMPLEELLKRLFGILF